MTDERILIAGIGNIFLGDDAFGVEVIRRLARRSLPDGVRVEDFGIRGIDLVYALCDGYESVILVDAVARGEPPGTLYLVEPHVEPRNAADPTEPLIDLHTMDPAKVLQAAQSLGGRVDRVLLIGCEPSPAADAEEMPQGLSEPVAAAVDEAVAMTESLVDLLLRGPPPARTTASEPLPTR